MMRMMIHILQREKPCPRECLIEPQNKLESESLLHLHLRGPLPLPYVPIHLAPTRDCKGNRNYNSQEGPGQPSIAGTALPPQGLPGVVGPGLLDPGRAIPASGGGAAAPWRVG